MKPLQTLRPLSRPSSLLSSCIRLTQLPNHIQTSTRSLSILSSRRPQLLASNQNAPLSITPTTSAVASPAPGNPDVLPKISSHPSLASIQVRNGPRNTFQGATNLVRKRRVGYLARLRSKKGKLVLKRRKLKGRKFLSH